MTELLKLALIAIAATLVIAAIVDDPPPLCEEAVPRTAHFFYECINERLYEVVLVGAEGNHTRLDMTCAEARKLSYNPLF